MADMLQRVQERGIMAKCRESGCFALNPNPQKTICWQCGRDSLRCPSCREAPILRYDSGKDFWKCPNANCSRKFAYRAKRHIVEPTISQEICPDCGKNLYYDAELLLWKCRNPVCRHIYTYQDLRREHVRRKAEPMPKQKVTPQAKHSYRSAKKPPSWRIRASPNTRKLFMSIAKLFLCLLVIADLGVIARTGCLLFTHQIAAVTGTTIFLAEAGLLIWIISVLRSSRFRWRKPSFKLVFWSLLIITLVCTFAGIEPMSSIKDKAIGFIGQVWQGNVTPAESSASGSVNPNPTPIKPSPSPVPQPAGLSILELEEETFRLINMERNSMGAPSTTWNAELYELSRAHTQAMADRGELFHTPIGASYAENCWMGIGYHSDDRLPGAIVDSWMSSPLHRAWLLHEPLRTSVVSIVKNSNGVYASWTFWMTEAQGGPELVREIADEWHRETGGSIPWIEWLKMKGYL